MGERGEGGGRRQNLSFAKSIDLHTLSKNTLTHLKMSFNKKFFNSGVRR